MKWKTSETIPGAHGRAFEVKKGQEVKITDLEGEQVIDFAAFIAPDYNEYFSVTHTRFHLKRLYLREGDIFLTNFQNEIAELIEDTVGIHNMTAPSCDPIFYKNLGGDPNHRNCHQNFTDAFAEYGIEEWRVPDPLNFFQDTPNLFHESPEDNREISLGRVASKRGDYVRLRFLADAVFAVSACPFTMFGFNGGKSTSIEVKISN